MSEWYYVKGEQRHGPVGTDDLNQLAASGVLDASDLVWREGMADWLPASAVDGLAVPNFCGKLGQPLGTSGDSANDMITDFKVPQTVLGLLCVSALMMLLFYAWESFLSLGALRCAQALNWVGAMVGVWLIIMAVRFKGLMAQGNGTHTAVFRLLLAVGILAPAFALAYNVLDLGGSVSLLYALAVLPVGAYSLVKMREMLRPSVPRQPQAPAATPTASAPQPTLNPPAMAVAESDNGGEAPQGDPLAALASFANRAKAAGRIAAERAKKVNATIPSRIKVGNTSIPKSVAIGGVVLLLVVVGWLLVGGTPNLTAAKLQAAYAGISGGKSGPYDEKIVKVTGEVANTSYYDPSNSVAPDRTFVALQTGTADEVMCIFRGRRSGSVDLDRLSSGDQISVKGKCTGRNMVGGVVVEECEVTAGHSH